jgi:hypothetical protein
MGGVFQGDVIIKAMVDLGIEEMKKNDWLLDHAFESLLATKYIADKYGRKQIEAAKEWLANNKIDVYMRPREDKDQLPMVTIFPLPSNEKPEMKTLGDMSTIRKILMPNEIGKPIPWVVKPFTPLAYDTNTGLLALPITTPGIETVVAGQVLANPDNRTGYIIQGVIGISATVLAIQIQPGTPIPNSTQLGVVPEFQYYEARVEHTFNQETYSIGCYAHGDVQNLIWLHTIVYYAIMRYRQTLLEGSGFAESVVNSGEIGEDPNFTGPGGEEAYTRFITLTGQVEQSWIKAPQRFIESVVVEDHTAGLVGGIKILTNEPTPAVINPQNESWFTVEDTGDDE